MHPTPGPGPSPAPHRQTDRRRQTIPPTTQTQNIHPWRDLFLPITPYLPRKRHAAVSQSMLIGNRQPTNQPMSSAVQCSADILPMLYPSSELPGAETRNQAERQRSANANANANSASTVPDGRLGSVGPQLKCIVSSTPPLISTSPLIPSIALALD